MTNETDNNILDITTMSEQDLKAKISELITDNKFDETTKYIEELSKRTKVKPVDTSEKSTKEKIDELVNKKVLKKDDKEKLRKLIEQNQKERETKQNEILNNAAVKAKNPVINNLYWKLLEDYDNPNQFKKIEWTAKRWLLPFIPSYRGISDEKRKELKKKWIITFDLWKSEILSIKRRTIRWRMNRASAYFNKLWEDEKDTQKAMDYIFSMSRKREWWRLGASLLRWLTRWIRKFWLDNTKEEFDIELERQNKLFLDSISTWEEQDEEKVIMTQIKERVDFYIKNYKLMQAKKRLN